MYSAQTEGLKLISLNDSGKKDFFLQLMNLNSFDECKTEVNLQLGMLRKTEIQLNQSLASLRAKIETYTESVVEILIPDFTHPDILRAKLESFPVLDKPDTSKFDILEKKLSEEYMRLHTLEVENGHMHRHYEGLSKKYQALQNTHHEKILCPHCQKSFSSESSHLKTQQEAISNELKELETQLFDLTYFSNQKDAVKATIERCKAKRVDALEEYSKHTSILVDIKNELQYSERCQRDHVDKIAKNQDLNIKISKCNVQVAEIETKLEILLKDIELHESMLAIFGPTGAPAYILDSAIDVFNDKVMQYASLIWPNASYALQSFKENKSGEVKAKFSEKLTINGKERSIGALSGGEHRCLSLAVDFAVIDVLETMFGMSLNPIMLDEPFNDLDTSNRERVLELLDKISTTRQVWIVDHASECKAMFSNVIKVEKRSGISAVV
jgi:DNA repair exonuclease SbcCD ATPase subunit